MAGRVFCTGDTHGDIDIAKLNTKNWPEQKKLDKDDILIILGDAAFCWDNAGQDRWITKWFNDKPFTTFAVLGNHENYDLIEQLPIVDFHDGKAYQVADSVFYGINGEIYNFGGQSFFCFGGATSTDKAYRKPHKSWWPQEIPTKEQEWHGINNLEKVNYKVDNIITHCGPKEIVSGKLGFSTDVVNSYLSYILAYTDFGNWWLGHYHLDRNFPLTPTLNNIHLLYDDIVEIQNERNING